MSKRRSNRSAYEDVLNTNGDVYKKEHRLNHPDYYLHGSHFKVIVRNGRLEQALKRFKNMTKKSGLKEILIENSFYTKPSERRKTVKKEAIRRERKASKSRKIDDATNTNSLWI